MNKFIQLKLDLDKEEWLALRAIARKDYREPAKQARLILRSILLGEQTTENKNGDTPTFQGGRVTIGA